MALEMAEKLKDIDCEIVFDEMLAAYTTFQVGGPADALALPETEDELVELIERCRSEAFPVTVLGGGANTLVRDGGVRGVVIAFPKGFRGIEVIEESTRAHSARSARGREDSGAGSLRRRARLGGNRMSGGCPRHRGRRAGHECGHRRIIYPGCRGERSLGASRWWRSRVDLREKSAFFIPARRVARAGRGVVRSLLASAGGRR